MQNITMIAMGKVQKGFLSAKVVHKLPLQNDTSSKKQEKKI